MAFTEHLPLQLTGDVDNAYVSGLQEDLKLHGNELVELQTMYTVGAVVGQLPFAYLFTKFPMSWVIPFLDIMWGVFTLLQYRVNSFGEMMVYRFFVGWFEAAFFPGMHYIFGEFIFLNNSQNRTKAPAHSFQGPGTAAMRLHVGEDVSTLGLL